ncbi:hypothetical protein AB0M46_25290 [Dactylosporangium sp. NPDC051485]|uniref:hypothetical protein n=1 Tax=Dactylosporangium sp. NPDC051485 TaxID=3154846 RepID=UPI00344736C9
MSPEVAALCVAALAICGYLALVVMHLIALRARGAADDRYRPRLALWLARTAQRRRDRFERDAVRLLLAGRIDRARYHTAMAAMAAQDRAEQPPGLPRPQR